MDADNIRVLTDDKVKGKIMTYVPIVDDVNWSIDKAYQEQRLVKKVTPYSKGLSLKKGQTLKIKEEASPSLYYIEEGAMDVSYTMDGTKIVVALLGPDEFFGEIGFFDGIARVRDVSAIEDTIVNVFTSESVDRMQKEDPTLHGRFMTLIARSVCKKFRKLLREREPIQAYTASLSVAPHNRVESQPLPLNFFETPEGKESNQMVEELKAYLFNISLSLQKDASEQNKEKVRFDFNTAMDSFFEQLGQFNRVLERSEMEEEVWGYLFKETFPYFMRSSLTQRAYFKPNGYAGDFKMIDMIYENQPSGDGRFGELVDEWLLDRLPCHAVRARRRFLSDLLKKESHRVLSDRDQVNIMNLACGPSRELFDFIKEFDQDDKITATCLDIDPEALKFTDELSASVNHRANIRVMKDNLIKWALGTSSHHIEKQDIIYSAGLFDYLDQDLFIMLADRCYDALKPGGMLVVGNFKPNPDKVFMDRLLDWRLIYREKEELLSIFSSTQFQGQVEVVSEQEARIQLFAIAIKD